jgi:hypothetical protein
VTRSLSLLDHRSKRLGPRTIMPYVNESIVQSRISIVFLVKLIVIRYHTQYLQYGTYLGQSSLNQEIEPKSQFCTAKVFRITVPVGESNRSIERTVLQIVPYGTVCLYYVNVVRIIIRNNNNNTDSTVQANARLYRTCIDSFDKLHILRTVIIKNTVL